MKTYLKDRLRDGRKLERQGYSWADVRIVREMWGES
jgi:hypothetical protein